MIFGRLGLSLACAVALLPVTAPHAAEFPADTVKVVIPFAPGGGNDLTGRFVADQLSKIWGKPVIVDNRPGASTAIGTAHVVKAKPDGYTLLSISSTMTTVAATQKLPYDPIKDLVPVAMIGKAPMGLAVGPKTPVKSVQELIEAAKSRDLLYGTSGPGSIGQFSAELFNKVAGIETSPVHYKSGGEAGTSILSGETDLYFSSVLQLEPMIKSGQLTGLMIAGTQRVPGLPDVPTAADAGLPDAVAELWWGLFAPAGTPDEIVAKINADVNTFLAGQEAIDFLAKGGAYPTPGTPEDFAAAVKDELAKWNSIAEERGLRME